MANELPYGDYVPTEQDLYNLVGDKWPEKLRKDYIAGKVTSSQLLQFINNNQAAIDDLEIAVVVIDGRVTNLELRMTTAEGEIDTLQIDLAAHVGAQSAHGSTGDIVGTDDYCTAILGGTVLLASAVTDATDSAIPPITSVAAAGAAYVQAYAQSQTDAINILANDLQTLQTSLNDAIAVINSALSTERTAKQRAV